MEQDGAVDPVGRPIERRKFVRLLVGGIAVSTLAMVVTPLIGFLIPPRRTTSTGGGGPLLVGTADEIGPGRSKVVALGGKPVIVLDSPQGMRAFSAVCTHLGCIVGYDASLSPDIVSPCHNGHFNAINGTVVSGPPPTPLKAYAVATDMNQVYVQDA